MDNVVWKVKLFDSITARELYSIIKARLDVFVVEQNCPYSDLDNYDQIAIHVWAEKDDEVLAYCRVFDKGVKYSEASIGRVLTTDLARGKGLGKVLIANALDVIWDKFETREIRISAQDYLIKFYSDFGFRDTGKKYLEDHLPHTEMVKVD